MKARFDLRQLVSEESSINAYGIPTKRYAARIGNVRSNEVEGGFPCIFERDRRFLYLVEQSRFGVHLANDLVHFVELFFCRSNDKVGSLANNFEGVIGNERCHFDDDVAAWVEAGHLEIHPNEHAEMVLAENPSPRQRAQAIGGRFRVTVADVQVLRLDEELPEPTYARPGDAGADLFARTGAVLAPQGGRALIATGVAVALTEGFAGLVLPRSGLAISSGVTCLNAPGLIDSGYRGEIGVVLINTDPTEPYEVHRGDRIAQLVIVPIEIARFIPAEALPKSNRGEGGFGHSGR
jgi:dUTP pyrophosphatase